MADDLTKGTFARSFTVDLPGPVQAINPVGAESDPDIDTATGWLLFDATATEVIVQNYQLPHGFVEGDLGSFEPHIHWHKATANPMTGTVAWRLRYRWSNPGTVWTAWSDPITVTVPSISDGNTAELHALTSFGDIPLVGAKISACILCEFARVGSADTFGGDAVMTSVDCHVLVNQPGSADQYVKYHSR